MRVTACVVSWNSGGQLDAALDSLAAQDFSKLDIVVIDNASRDDSAERVRARGDVRLVANATNRGFTGAANQAAALAAADGSDALLLCNFDVRLAPAYVSSVVDALREDPGRASVQGRLLRSTPRADGVSVIDTTGHLAFRTRLFRNRGEGEPDGGSFEEPGEVFGVSGALALYRLEALADVACDGEVFDDDLFAYWEDVDLDWRLQLRGWRSWYAPAARGWHERGGAGPRRSAVVERLNFVNRFHVVLKNDDLASLARALPGVGATTLLKAGELAISVPSAFARSLPEARRVPRMLRKRRQVQAAARIDPADVIARWFDPFDYPTWVRTWWRRVTAAPRQ